MDWSRRSLAWRESGSCGFDFVVGCVIIGSAGVSGGCGDRKWVGGGALGLAERLADPLDAQVEAADRPLVEGLASRRAAQITRSPGEGDCDT